MFSQRNMENYPLIIPVTPSNLKHWVILSHDEKRVPLKPMPGDKGSVATLQYVTAHKQTELNQACNFHFLKCYVLPEDLSSEFVPYEILLRSAQWLGRRCRVVEI